MTRRTGLLLLLFAALCIPACNEDREKVTLSAEDNAILREKADEKIGIIVRENLPALFAGVVVFGTDAFLSQSAMLDRANISVLNMYGKTAILLLNSPDIPFLLKDPTVKKVYYLCRQGGLARLDTPFEMDLMRRFEKGLDAEPFPLLVRYREIPEKKDEDLLRAAGFTVRSKAGAVWVVEGPPRFLYRLLESDRIIYYEGASKVLTK